MRYKKLHTDITGTEEGHLLAQQFREIVRQLEMVNSMEIIVRDYCHRNPKKGKGTVDADILSDKMTFRTFIILLVDVIGVEDMSFITSVTRNGVTAMSEINPF